MLEEKTEELGEKYIPEGVPLNDERIKHVLGRVAVMMGNIIQRKVSGEIIIQFHEGVYQRSKAVITERL